MLPTPLAMASNLDLECYRTNPYTPPTTTVVTRHLNPALADLPAEAVTLGNRDKLCVPVAKNNVLPPPGVIDFVRFVDLSCYRIQGMAVNRILRLHHLNPVLRNMGVPDNHSAITSPQHLCVPVIKNGVVPPSHVLRLVQHIDLKCYGTSLTSLNIPLTLSHLNPVLANLPRHAARVTDGRQLCVPVAKNNELIPADVLNIVRWIDLQMYDIVTDPLPVMVNLSLRHINPSLASLPPESASLVQAIQLGLPVAKNNMIPPS
ncbi:MAG TPA: hypothetical protein VFM55_11680 [Micromonosporaceae bacterium]|nr:hypothetical protein [Micromonosporaceae bacterium]